MKTPLCTYTHLAFLINWIMDERPKNDLTFAEIHEAAEEKRFIELLRERYGHIADFSLLRNDGLTPNLPEMEAALSQAASVLQGCEAGKACVEHSGLCLAQAIVLEAIQEQFHRTSQGPLGSVPARAPLPPPSPRLRRAGPPSVAHRRPSRASA